MSDGHEPLKQVHQQWRPAVLLLGVAAALALLWAVTEVTGRPVLDRDRPPDLVALGLAFAGYVLGGVLNVVVHEAGHLVVGVAVRLRLLGWRVGPFEAGLRARLGGTAGHVLVDVGAVRGNPTLRLVPMLLAGPASNGVVAYVATQLATDPTRTTGFRCVAVGVAVISLYFVVVNLAPLTPRDGVVTDGRQALRWLLRPTRERSRVELAVHVARLHAARGGTDDAYLADLREAVADERPEVASVAVDGLLDAVARLGLDGEAEAERMTAFAQRGDVSGEVRAGLCARYVFALARPHLPRLRSGVPSRYGRPGDPGSAVVALAAQVAEQARAADRHSLEARTALALARVMQARPEESSRLLVDVPASASSTARARAHAVRSFAEADRGEPVDAGRLAAAARRLAPDDPLVRLVTTSSGD